MSSLRSVVQTLVHPEEPVDSRVDMVELRLDLYPGMDVAAFRRRCSKPVITKGGVGGDYVDVDLGDTATPGPRRIVSYHDFVGVPDDLDAIYERCLLTGADLVKVAVTPRNAAEAFRLLDLPIAGIGMGEYGTFTRVLAHLTYCATTAVAPGMPTPDELFEVFRIRRLGAAPALYGVAGDPIEHSQGPGIHNAAFERDGIDAVYLRFKVARLDEFWPAFVDHGGRGLSVTAPLKLQAAELASRPDSDVEECGAANTLLADGRAFNTDLRAFLDVVPAGSGPALVMGRGGAGRAAVVALRRLGHDVTVWTRHDPWPSAAPLVVNATPLDPPDAPFVVDLRYGPGIAPPARGIDGLAFLHAQAKHQYRIFTGNAL